METTLKIKTSDLDIDFINAIKSLFKNDSEIEITISSPHDFGLLKTETKEEYITRINNAAQNITKGNVVVFSEKKFDKLYKQLLGEK